ncbi:MAG: gamma-glutamyltransferase, partial [Candidatus Latescibacteria bacterium]|nr:gamma-glutamyltransferase [Candidatus Latescibacterota bacterium]
DQQVYEASGPAIAETLHVSAADAEGNLVGITITQGGAFGSCLTVPGTGIILGHGMCRLDPRPGRANSVAAHKRPLNNVVPMILRLPQRDVAIGLPGGRRIISVGAQLGQRIIDFNATALGAATALRLNAEAQEPLELKRGIPKRNGPPSAGSSRGSRRCSRCRSAQKRGQSTRWGQWLGRGCIDRLFFGDYHP